MLEKIKNTIRESSMLENGDKILVALSGGADSICLCMVLKELGYNIGAAHINHKIRKEADDDMNFAADFCEKNQIAFHILEKDVKAVAKEEKISEELAGRNVRYGFFNETAEKYGYNKIAVAHNKNDNAETMLLNLLRGSGSKGLCAIPKTRGNIIRPLIDVKREEIENYLREKGQEFVTDKTNFDCDYTRNKIRNKVIPVLLEVNNNFIDNAFRTSEIIKEENEFLDECALKLVKFDKETSYISKEDFLNAHKAVKARAIHFAYEYASGTGKDLEKRHIDYICENVKKETLGNILELGFNTLCFAEYERICFAQKKERECFEYELKTGESIEIKEVGMRVIAQYVSPENIAYGENTEYFDLETDKVILRSFKEGDVIIPMGMNSAKKLKEIFINEKIPQKERCKKIIVDKDGVLCVIGVKRSDCFKINKDTKKVLMIKGEKLC